MHVIENNLDILRYLEKRNLLKKYLKARRLLASDNLKSVDFKKRNPKSSRIYYFRIDIKYRAIGHFKKDYFVVTRISPQQEK